MVLLALAGLLVLLGEVRAQGAVRAELPPAQEGADDLALHLGLHLVLTPHVHVQVLLQGEGRGAHGTLEQHLKRRTFIKDLLAAVQPL